MCGFALVFISMAIYRSISLHLTLVLGFCIEFNNTNLMYLYCIHSIFITIMTHPSRLNAIPRNDQVTQGSGGIVA